MRGRAWTRPSASSWRYACWTAEWLTFSRWARATGAAARWRRVGSSGRLGKDGRAAEKARERLALGMQRAGLWGRDRGGRLGPEWVRKTDDGLEGACEGV